MLRQSLAKKYVPFGMLFQMKKNTKFWALNFGEKDVHQKASCELNERNRALSQKSPTEPFRKTGVRNNEDRADQSCTTKG
ncbi:LOW QUALITY PROTEIN: hypothetical protein TorRG33x02_120260 [Trema orientale]|uniref:Uncharacterized protein n=1 Tax=Trema orientale TaxID=63057 RepID=A0A2P5F328_TREOI|nr:LOW QUALITY PROTEIN: hypothetical protein TorRG33x02_120260 [Trema orientale]